MSRRFHARVFPDTGVDALAMLLRYKFTLVETCTSVALDSSHAREDSMKMVRPFENVIETKGPDYVPPQSNPELAPEA
jgi:hypothetical protein